MANFKNLYTLLIVVSTMFSSLLAKEQLQRSMSQSSFAASHEEASKSQEYSSSNMNMNMGNQMFNQPPLGQACPIGQPCNVNGQASQQFNQNSQSQKSAHFQNFQQSSSSQGHSFEIPITCSCCESKLLLSVKSVCNAQGNHFQNFAASNIGGQHRSQATTYNSASLSAGGEFHEVASKQHMANLNGNTHGYNAHRANHNGDISGSTTVHKNGQSATFNSAQFNAAQNCPQGNCFNAPSHLQQLNGMQNSNYLEAEAHKSQFKESSSHHSDMMQRSQIGGSTDMTNMNMNSNKFSMSEHESMAASKSSFKIQDAHMATMNTMTNANSFNAQSHDMSKMHSKSASQMDAHAASLQQSIARQAACPNCLSPVPSAASFAGA